MLLVHHLYQKKRKKKRKYQPIKKQPSWPLSKDGISKSNQIFSLGLQSLGGGKSRRPALADASLHIPWQAAGTSAAWPWDTPLKTTTLSAFKGGTCRELRVHPGEQAAKQGMRFPKQISNGKARPGLAINPDGVPKWGGSLFHCDFWCGGENIFPSQSKC